MVRGPAPSSVAICFLFVPDKLSYPCAVGDGFPGASVTGVDLSPIQPHWVPPNVQFVVDDIEDRWLHGDNFDLIHLRAMSVVLRDPPKVIKEIYR